MHPARQHLPPPLTRLSRTSLLFLGSLALSGHAQSVPAAPRASAPKSPSVPPREESTHAKQDKGTYYRMEMTEHDDRRFLTETEYSLRRELEVSETVVQNAQDPALRSLAEEIMATQREIANELSALATKRKVRLNATASGARAAQPRLDPRNANFTSAYLTLMAQDLRRAARLFHDAAQHSNDDEIRAFAAKYAPRHEQLLAAVEARQGGKG